MQVMSVTYVHRLMFLSGDSRNISVMLLKFCVVCVALSDDGNRSNTYQQCFACSITVEELKDTEKRC